MVIGSRLVHQPDATVIKRGRHLYGLVVSSKNAFASPHCEVRVNDAFLVIKMRVGQGLLNIPGSPSRPTSYHCSVQFAHFKSFTPQRRIARDYLVAVESVKVHSHIDLKVYKKFCRDI